MTLYNLTVVLAAQVLRRRWMYTSAAARAGAVYDPDDDVQLQQMVLMLDALLKALGR